MKRREKKRREKGNKEKVNNGQKEKEKDKTIERRKQVDPSLL